MNRESRSSGSVRSRDSTSSADMLVTPGLSIHIFGKVVGIYSSRIDAGRGFVEMPIADFAAIVAHFSTASAKALLEGNDEA